MLDFSNESQNTASCSEDSRSIIKDKKDNEDDRDYEASGNTYGI